MALVLPLVRGGVGRRGGELTAHSVALVSLPIAGLSALLLPRVRAVAGGARARDKLARMDLAGVALLMAGLVLFVLAFTQAGVAGWRSAAVVAPLILSFALVPVFLIWEQRRPRGYSLLPHDIWQFPNIFPLIIHSTTPFLCGLCRRRRP